MDIGIGLPNSLPGTTGRQLLDWAQRAEQRPGEKCLSGS